MTWNRFTNHLFQNKALQTFSDRLLALLQPDKDRYYGHEIHEKHGRINALIAIFPCPFVDFVAIKKMTLRLIWFCNRCYRFERVLG